MKFEVTDKHEKSEGLVFKKTIYYCNIRVELSDEEFEALESMAKDKNWKNYLVGNYMLDPTRDIEMRLETFYNWVKKEKGVWNSSGRSDSPEMRQLKIANVKEIAGTVKDILDTRLSALAQSDEDVCEEIQS